MPPIVIPPLVKAVMAAVGVAAVAHWVAREVRRINDDLDRLRTASAAEAAARRAYPTLRRDPATGVWRLP